MEQYYDPYGASPQFAPQGYGDPSGGMGQQYLPYGAEAQFAPQGWLGNAIGSIAGPVGGMIGARFGNPNIGRQIGGVAGNLARRFIPFSAGPEEYAPQGYGDPSGGMGQQYAPYGAEAQFAPQGWLGNAIGSIAGPVGGMIGARFGNPNIGRQIGGVAGNLARRFIPFNAGPEEYAPQGYGDPSGGMGQQYAPYGAEAQFAPQGWVGNWIGRLAGPVGGMVAGPLGGVLGTGAGALARRFLPFSAGPEEYAPQGYGDPSGGMGQQYAPYGAEAQFAPQGWLGNAIGSIAGPVGGMIGARFGNPNIGRQLGGVAGNLARRFIPFSAGPEEYAAQGYGDPSGGMGQQYVPYGAEAQFAPQGWVGNAIGSIAGPVGGLIGGRFGNPNLGRQIGGFAGNLARRFIPFSADPYDPYGQQGWGTA